MRRKRILPSWKLFNLSFRNPGPNRLVEVITNYHIPWKRQLHIMCLKCAKKKMTEDNKHLNRSIYMKNQFSVNCKTPSNVTRIGETAGPFEKLRCERCGQKNEQ